MPNRLIDLEITEVSFVDNPADPNARIELFKRDTSGDDTRVLWKNEPSSADVMVEEVLGSKDPKKRKKKMEEDDDLAKGDDDSYASDDPDTEERHMPDLEFTPEQEEHVRKVEDQLLDAEEAIEVLTATVDDLQKTLAEDDSPDDESDILKSADPEVVELLKAAEARAAEAEEVAKAERSARLLREAVEKAATYDVGVPKQELGEFLHSAGEVLDGETMDKLHGILKSATETAETAAIFKEIGGGGESLTDAEEKLDSIAKGYQSDGTTYEQAYERALTENPDLYAETLGGN